MACLEEQLKHQVDRCLSIAGEFFDREFFYDRLTIDLRGMSAGQYRQLLQRNRVIQRELRFNPVLLASHGAGFIAEVVPHECAHLVAFEQYGRKIRPHGREWQSIMTEVFGRSPKVRHSFEVVRPVRLTFEYRCRCEARVHALSAIRHNRIVRGASRYLCQFCRAELVRKQD